LRQSEGEVNFAHTAERRAPVEAWRQFGVPENSNGGKWEERGQGQRNTEHRG
jgi:hypothetical protein